MGGRIRGAFPFARARSGPALPAGSKLRRGGVSRAAGGRGGSGVAALVRLFRGVLCGRWRWWHIADWFGLRCRFYFLHAACPYHGLRVAALCNVVALIFIVNAAQAERETAGLHESLVPQHSARHYLPRLCGAGAFLKILCHLHRVGSTFDVNSTGAGEGLAIVVPIVGKIAPIEILLPIANRRPAISPHHRHDTTAALREGVNLPQERV